MWGAGRKFSTLRKRLSFSNVGDDLDGTNTREGRELKAQLKSKGKSRTRQSTDSGSTDTESYRKSGSISIEEIPTNQRSHRVSNITTKSFNGGFESMPSPEEVEKLLEKTLEELAVTQAGRAKFQTMSTEAKWKVVQANSTHQSKKQKNIGYDVKSAKFWIKKISQLNSKGRPRMTPKEALNMESVFRTAHKDFLTDFLEGMGVSYMNKLTTKISQRLRRERNESKVLMSLIECYRLLMNTELGMRGVLIVPGSVDAIAMSMDFIGGNTQITERVILLLSVMCWWDEEGRMKVMASMRHLKKRFMEISTFQTIVYLFQHTENPTFKANVATFITTVCNTPPDIEQRVGVRNYFFRLDIIKVFQKVLEKAPEKELDEEGPWNTVNTQYQVFVAMMRQDQEEIVHKLVAAADADDSHFDLSNLQESWKILQKNAFKADCQLELLNLVQALFLVPTVHDLAVPIYESISKFVYEASSMDRVQLSAGERYDFSEQPPMDFEELGKLLKKKIEYNARMEVFSEKEGIVKRLRKLVGVMQKRLMDVASGEIPHDEAMDLQEDLIKNHLLNPDKRQPKRKPRVKKSKTQTLALSTVPSLAAGGVGGGGVTGDINISFLAGLGLMDTAGEIEIMKERENKMKKEIDILQKEVQALKKGGFVVGGKGTTKGGNNVAAGGAKVDPNAPKIKLDSTGLAPAGIATGKTLQAPPAVPRPGMPGSLENAPIEFKGTSSATKQPRATGAKGGKKPAGGGLEAMFGARAANVKKPRNNKAEKYKEALNKLGLPDKKAHKPGCKMTQVFWKVIAPDALEGTIWPELSDQSVQYDPVALEEMFGKSDAKKRATLTEKKVDEEVKLIDGKRRQNLGIALKRVKLAFPAIRAAIDAVDLSVISKDNIQVFIETVPTPDEVVLLNKFKKDNGDQTKLPFEERYLYEVSEIPNLLNRLKCIQTYYKFPYDARRIHSVIVRMKGALKEVNNSSELREILQVVLAIGNYMNGASARGAAWGFKIEILANIINVKAGANNGTLMHYLYALFEKNYPQLCEFSLPLSAEVVDINFKETIKEMNILARQVSALKQELKRKPYSKADKLKKNLQSFEVKASRDCEKLQQILEQVRTDFHTLALKFAEKGDECQPNTFFPKLVDFERDLKRAGSQLVEMRESDARRIQQEAKKQERIAYKKLKILVEKTKNENGEIDMGLIEAYKKSQQGKANQVVDRFLEKYNRDKKKKPMRSRNRRSKRIPGG